VVGLVVVVVVVVGLAHALLLVAWCVRRALGGGERRGETTVFGTRGVVSRGERRVRPPLSSEASSVRRLLDGTRDARDGGVTRPLSRPEHRALGRPDHVWLRFGLRTA
jgi:hypothetical protein